MNTSNVVWSFVESCRLDDLLKAHTVKVGTKEFFHRNVRKYKTIEPAIINDVMRGTMTFEALEVILKATPKTELVSDDTVPDECLERMFNNFVKFCLYGNSITRTGIRKHNPTYHTFPSNWSLRCGDGPESLTLFEQEWGKESRHGLTASRGGGPTFF